MTDESRRRAFVGGTSVQWSCKTCRFFHPNKHQDHRGECRRHPPVPDRTRSPLYPADHLDQVPISVETGRWPDVAASDWCGEWQHIPDSGFFAPGD